MSAETFPLDLNPTFNCFGFYSGGLDCRGCKEALRCKALLNSDFIDVLGDALDEMVDDLPEGTYADSPFMWVMLNQILHPPVRPKQTGETVPGLPPATDDLVAAAMALGLEDLL